MRGKRLERVRIKRVKPNKVMMKGVRVMAIQNNQSVGICIRNIQAIASKYAYKNIEEEEKAEKEFREYLLKQGYTRF